MSLRMRFVLSALLLMLAGIVPISWYALGAIDQSVAAWHDVEVGAALRRGLLEVDNPEAREQIHDALVRYQQLGALQRPQERSMIVVGVGVALLTILIAVAAALLLSHQLTRPLRSLARAARRIAEEGDLSHTVPSAGIAELRALVDSFNDMVVSLRESRAALATAERRAAWQDIARAIAHEIKNPLTPMRLTTERLRERFTDNPERFEESFMRSTEMILTEIDRLERLANGFSSFAKMPPPAMRHIDMRSVVARVGELLEAQAEEGNLAISLPEHPVPVMGDREQLEQAVLNLVKNGLEAVPQDGGEVAVTLSATGNRVELVVTDNGPGIDAEVRDSLFQPYVSTKIGGSGIGLAVVDRVIADHRGRVNARNIKLHGAQFEIQLPLGLPLSAAPEHSRADSPTNAQTHSEHET
jgi:two-component system, NtrC family, nitrogen regulation sensor histidine kinase NtrY